MTTSYDIIVAAWNLSSSGVGTLPNGISGTPLAGLSTAAKIIAINSWIMTSSIPTSMSGNDIINCVAWSEFVALRKDQQETLLLLGTNGAMSLTQNSLAGGMIRAYFGDDSTTMENITSLLRAQAQTWLSASIDAGGAGYENAGGLHVDDLTSSPIETANGGQPLT